MLSKQSMDGVYPLTRNLDLNGGALLAREGTTLAALVKNSTMQFNLRDAYFQESDGILLYSDVLLANANNDNPITKANDHTEVMSAVVDKVASAVSKHLKFARTVVAPAVDELVQRTKSLIDECARSSILDLQICISKVPAPLMEPSLLEAIEKAKDIVPSDFVMGAGLPNYSFEEIIQAVHSGNASLDQAVAQYLQEASEPAVCRVYGELFTAGSKHRQIASVMNTSEEDTTLWALLGYLFARKNWENPPEGTQMSAREYESYMLQVRDFCAVTLIRVLVTLERDEKVGVLVRSFENDQVNVNEKVYKDFLNAGGTNEILFGSLLSTTPVYHKDKILDRSDEFSKSWEHYKLMNMVTESNLKFDKAKKLMSYEFMDIFKDLTPEDCPVQDRQGVVTAFEEALQKTTLDEIKDIYKWVLRLLCCSRFRHTDAYRYLDGICRIKTMSPDVTTKEAAAVATIEYISTWLYSQMNLVALSK